MNSEAIISIDGFEMTTGQWSDADYLAGHLQVGALSKAGQKTVQNRLGTLAKRGVTPTGADRTKEVMATVISKVRHNLLDTKTFVANTLEYAFYPATPDNNIGEEANYGRNPFEYAVTVIKAIRFKVLKTALDDTDVLELAAANVYIKIGGRDILKAPLLDFIGLELATSHLNATDKVFYKQVGKYDLEDRKITLGDNDSLKVVVKFKGMTTLATKKMQCVLESDCLEKL